MANLTLLVLSLAMSVAHSISAMNVASVNGFFVLISMRYCLSSVYAYGSSSAFASLYNRAILRETIVADIYFMIRTGTLTNAGWFILISMSAFQLSWIIKRYVLKQDPFTLLLDWLAMVALTIAHVLIMVSF